MIKSIHHVWYHEAETMSPTAPKGPRCTAHRCATWRGRRVPGPARTPGRQSRRMQGDDHRTRTRRVHKATPCDDWLHRPGRRRGGSMSSASLREPPNRRIRVGAEHVAVRVARARPRRRQTAHRAQHPFEVIVPASDQRIDDVLGQGANWIACKLNASRTVSERPPALGRECKGIARRRRPA
jgi:hypothetical protein